MLQYEEPIAKSLDVCWKVVLRRSSIILVSAAIGTHVSGGDPQRERWAHDVHFASDDMVQGYLPVMCYYELLNWTEKPVENFPLMAFSTLDDAISYAVSCSYRDTLEIFASVYEPDDSIYVQEYGIIGWYDKVDIFRGRIPNHTVLASRLMPMEQVDWR